MAGGRPPVLAAIRQFAKLPFGAEERRAQPRPTDAADYEPPELDGSGLPVAAVARGKTPQGGYREFPLAVLAESREPLAPGAPDLRGVWECHKGAMKGHVERIEQAGDRVCITAGGVIHDMQVTGRKEDGVNDIAGPTGAPISVAADFRDGRLDLRPGGGTRVLVTRYRDGDELVWRYGPFRNRLRRLTAPPDDRVPTEESPMAALTPRPPEWTPTAPVKVSATREMRATPDEVFEALADHETWPEWFDALTKVERIGDLREGLGSRRRVHIGGRLIVDEEFIVWEPGKAWGFTVFEASNGMLRSLNELVTIQQTGPDRSRVTYLMAMDPGPALKVLLRLGARRQIAKNLGTALEKLGERVGSGSAA